MSKYLERLRKGERWWGAEIAMRSLGILLLYGCYNLGLAAQRWAAATPRHQATQEEFGLCLGVAILLSSGLGLTLFGPGLCKHVPIPPHSAWSWKDR